MMGPTEPVVSGVIAYNGDSQRGWNDPPTLAFTGINAVKKGPKLDLRKRVSHQEALTGRKTTSPSYPNSTVNSFKQPSQINTGLSSLILSQPQPSVQHDQSPIIPSPCHSRHSSGSFTPPLIPEHQNLSNSSQISCQFPSQNYPLTSSNTNIYQLPPTPVHPLRPVTTTNSVCPMVPLTTANVLHPIPLVPSTVSTAPPVCSPVTTSPPSSLGKPLFSPKGLNMTPISSALDTSHVRSDILLEPSQQTQDCSNSLHVFLTKENTTPYIFNPSPTTSKNFPPNFINDVGNKSPVLHRSGSSPRLYTPPPPPGSGRSSPAPPPKISPVSTPTGIHSGHNTPRNNSPETVFRSCESSRCSSEDFDGKEALNVTVESLEETIIKCSKILKNREIEDVKKKLGIMKQQWEEDKLSIPVQKTMKLLAKALLESDTHTSHELHVQLIVDYVGEVKQWMVAIKRLISAVRNLNS